MKHTLKIGPESRAAAKQLEHLTITEAPEANNRTLAGTARLGNPKAKAEKAVAAEERDTRIEAGYSDNDPEEYDD